MVTLEKIKFYFEYLYKKIENTPHRFIQHDGYDLKSIYSHKDDYCKWLFNAYKNKEFNFVVLKKKIVRVNEKERWIFQYPLPDLIIHYCAADYIKTITSKYISDSLFSYRKGRNSNQALTIVDTYIRKHKRLKRNDKKNCGLFVIRKDISKYSDSIDSSENSQIWNSIKNEIKDLNEKDQNTIYQCINPLHISESDPADTIPQRLNHLPMGSPLVGHLTNYYLHEQDEKLSAIKNCLYIRFGDDILFITDDFKACIDVDTYIVQLCTDKGLKFNKEKSYVTYLTSPGRPYSLNNDPRYTNMRHSDYFEYLGMRIDFNHGLGLTNEKYKNLFTDLRVLINNYKSNLKLLGFSDFTDDHFSMLITEVNKLIVLNSEKNILYLDKIIKNISSHYFLKKIDLDIAYELLKAKQNTSSKKVFRNNAYKNLRETYKLKSLIKYKNEYYK